MESTGQNWRHAGSKATVDGTTIWHHETAPTTYRLLEGMVLCGPFSEMRIVLRDSRLRVDQMWYEDDPLPWLQTSGDVAADILNWIYNFADRIPYSLGQALSELAHDLMARSKS